MKNPPGTSQNWHINGSNVGVFTHWVGITLILHVLQWSQYTERNGERGKNSILFVIKQKTSVSAITASVQNWTKSYDTTYMWNLKKKVQINFFTKQKKSHRCRKQTYGLQGRKEVWRKDKLAGWDWHMYIIINILKNHQLNGHEIEQTPPGDGERQRNLACCSPWGSQRVELDLAIEQEHDTHIYMHTI